MTASPPERTGRHNLDPHLARYAARTAGMTASEIRALFAVDRSRAALEQCPDGVFVEVIDPGEHVVIAKSGGAIVIDVNDPDETVHVAVPLGVAESANHEIAAANQPM